MKIIRICSLMTLLAVFSGQATALNVVACETEWAALARTIGGSKVNVDSITHPFQDPHNIEARPSLIAKVRRADIMLCTGLDLEIGWLPMLQRKSNNPNIQSGSQNMLFMGDHVNVLEKMDSVDRSMGDIHAAGNPHIQLDPRNFLILAEVVSNKFVALDPANTEIYQKNLADFSLQWQQALSEWKLKLQSLSGTNAVAHHRDMAYLFDWLNIQLLNTLELTPGVAPSTGHLASLLQQLNNQKVSFIARANYQNEKAAQWLSNKTNIPTIEIPMTVGAEGKSENLIDWFSGLVNRLSETIQ